MHRLRVGDARRPASTRRAPPRCCSSPLLPPLRPASVAPAPDAPPQPPPFPDAAFIATGSTAPTAVADDTPGTADRVAAAGTDHHADTAPKAPPAGEGEGKTPAPSASFDERPARAPGPFFRPWRGPPRRRAALLGVWLPVPAATRRPWPAAAHVRLVPSGRPPLWRVRGGRVVVGAQGCVRRVARGRRGAGGRRGGQSRVAGNRQRGRRNVALFPEFLDLSSDWRNWAWPAATAATVTAAGLGITDVVAGVVPGYGPVDVLPTVEYGHQPDALPAAHMAEAVPRRGGRVLRVVYRQHPPLLRPYGPRSLRLDSRRRRAAPPPTQPSRSWEETKRGGRIVHKLQHQWPRLRARDSKHTNKSIIVGQETA